MKLREIFKINYIIKLSCHSRYRFLEFCPLTPDIRFHETKDKRSQCLPLLQFFLLEGFFFGAGIINCLIRSQRAKYWTVSRMNLEGQSLSVEAFPVITLKSSSSKHDSTCFSCQLIKQICCLSLLPPQPFIYLYLVSKYIFSEQEGYYYQQCILLEQAEQSVVHLSLKAPLVQYHSLSPDLPNPQ